MQAYFSFSCFYYGVLVPVKSIAGSQVLLQLLYYVLLVPVQSIPGSQFHFGYLKCCWYLIHVSRLHFSHCIMCYWCLLSPYQEVSFTSVILRVLVSHTRKSASLQLLHYVLLVPAHSVHASMYYCSVFVRLTLSRLSAC